MVEKTKQTNKETKETKTEDRLTGPRLEFELEVLVFGRMLTPVSRRWDPVDPTATFKFPSQPSFQKRVVCDSGLWV